MSKFNIKIETPTLARRAVVVEDEEFKKELKHSRKAIRDVINAHREKQKSKIESLIEKLSTKEIVFSEKDLKDIAEGINSLSSNKGR